MHGGPGMGRRGSNLSVAGKRRDRMDRKSICIEANAELSRFSMMLDVDKSSDLKKLKENEEKRRSKLDIVNRRVSVSNPNLAQDAALGLSVPKNNGRRLSLVIPGQDESPGGGGFNAGRRVSIGGRRNSTVFNFDPRALPNTQDVNLQAQPKKSALRRPSFVETFVEDDTDDLI